MTAALLTATPASDEAVGDADFDSWWNASKYRQVIYVDSSMRRVALDGWNAALSARTAAPAEQEREYRLLTARDTIQAGDEVLADKTTGWLPLAGWEVGMRYNPAALMPIRRLAGAKVQDGGE